MPGLLHIPITRHIPGYYIGVKLSEGWDAFWTYPYPDTLLMREGKGHGFLTVGRIVLSEDLEDYDGSPIRVLLTDKLKAGTGITIVLVRD